MVESASSQIKDGSASDGNAVGALMWKLGDVSDSNSELRANGVNVDTSKSASPQASAIGQYSIADALFPSPLDTIMDKGATICPIMTNVWLGIGIGAANVAAVIASFGGAAGGEAAAEGAAQVGVRVVVKQIISKIELKAVGKGVAKMVRDTLIQGGIEAGLTFIARQVVEAQVGQHMSSLSTGKNFTDMVDAGGNAHGQEIERQVLYGVPLTESQVASSNIDDQQFISAVNNRKSTFERYFALDNPQSLLTRTATMTMQHFNVQGITSMIGSIFNPSHAFAGAFGAITGKTYADTGTDTFNYGNVQWGLTPQEEAKVKLNPKTNLPGDPSYEMLANDKILDDSGKRDEIEAKYGVCYSDDTTVGTLLTEETGDSGDEKYYIVRTKSGDVDPNQGLCSQKQLSFNNPTYGDLVFRWRVSHAYDAALNQLSETQNLTDSGTANSDDSDGSTSNASTGWVWPVHKEDLDSQTAALAQCWLPYYAPKNGYHAAIDIRVTYKPVYAAHDGTIMNGGFIHDGYNTLVIDTGVDAATGKHLYAVYEHMSSLKSFKDSNWKVKAGQLIGTSGETGAPGAPHLHFGISDNSSQFGTYANPWHTANPLDFLPADYDAALEKSSSGSCQTSAIKSNPNYGFDKYKTLGTFDAYK